MLELIPRPEEPPKRKPGRPKGSKIQTICWRNTYKEWNVGRKFGFYLSLDFKKYEDDEMSKAMEMMQIIKQEKPPYRPKKKTAA